MDHNQLFTEFNVGAARQVSLNAEVRMRAEYNIREKRKLRAVAEATEAIRLRTDVFKFESVDQSLRSEVGVLRDRNAALEREKNELDVKVTDLSASVKVREQEVADLDAQVTAVKLQNDNLVGQDEKLEEVNEKFDKLCADFVDMALHLEEKFYPHLLTTIFGRRWLLTYGMGLAVAKCLNSTEYLSALGVAISKAVEKGMQEGLSARITHGAEGRQLADVAVYNPSAEAEYLSALQHLQNVNFSLLVELKSNKDASVDTIMNLIRLDDVLAERLGLTKSQPHVNQLMVHIHQSSDQRVVGASALSLSLEGELLKAKDGEIESLKAQLLLKKAEATEAIRLRADVFKFESVEQSLRSEVGVLRDRNAALEREKNELDVKVTDLSASVKVREQEVVDLDAQLEEVNEKFDKLCADFVDMALHLEEKFYPHLLTTISGRRWLLTYGMGLAVAKCLNSTEYLSALGVAIRKAVEKGMQEGLYAGITHGAEGRQLADVAVYNPSAEAEYLSALQHLQNVKFSLLVELKSNKDASVDTIMNLIRLDDVLAERLGLTESQPHVNQLMVPIHQSSDQRVVGASALSLSLE
nr:hypothetical protein [Tanacetum cinerariifolium]